MAAPRKDFASERREFLSNINLYSSNKDQNGRFISVWDLCTHPEAAPIRAIFKREQDLYRERRYLDPLERHPLVNHWTFLEAFATDPPMMAALF